MKGFSKKTIVTIFLISILISSIFSPALRFASATMPVVDWNAIWQSIKNFIKTQEHWLLEVQWKVLRDAAVKMIVDRLTDDIVRSIYNQGNPSYVRNWQDYLGEAGDYAFNYINEKFKKSNNGANLCAPFMPSIQINLRERLNYPYGRLPIECRFQDFKNNLKNSRDYIESGGWVAYDEMLIPSNNYWMTTLLVQDEYAKALNSKKQALQNEAIASKGFLSIKKCIKFNGGYSETSIKSECTYDGKVDDACVERAEKEWCSKWETQTPGDAVAESMTDAIHSNTWYINNVQSIISALVNVLVTKIIDKTKGGIAAVANGTGGKNTYNVDDGTQGKINDFNKSQLNDIKKEYKNFINYYSVSVLPYLNNSLSLINDISCVDNYISFRDSDGNMQTMKISDLNIFLDSSKSGLVDALTDAQNNLTFIDNIDYSRDALSVNQDMQTAITDYNNFTETYHLFVLDVSVADLNSGKFETLYSNIYNALNLFSCS